MQKEISRLAAGQTLPIRSKGLRLPIFVGLGAMILLSLGLISGCGSESNPGGTAKSKDAPAAQKSGALKSLKATPLLLGQGENGAEKKALGRKLPEPKHIIEVVPGHTLEEMEAKIAEEIAKHDPKAMVMPPGGPQIPPAEAAARMAADMANHDPKLMTMPPGGPQISPAEAAAKMAADMADHDPKVPNPVLPGAKISREEAEAIMAAELAKHQGTHQK